MNSETNKPYYNANGGTVPLKSPSYVKRKADTELYEKLKEGQICCVLNSRQMGKSSLSLRVLDELEKDPNYICLNIDISTLKEPGITKKQWYFGILTRLNNRIKEKIKNDWWNNFSVQKWFKDITNENNTDNDCFKMFIDDILLSNTKQNIVICIDEIDTVLSLPFSLDEFFALVRIIYNERDVNSNYQRLRFAFIGVLNPNDLLRNKNATPFNLGTRISLSGFELHETQALQDGLTDKVDNPQEVLNCIINWTGGQPFLTQYLCQEIYKNPQIIDSGKEKKCVEKIVNDSILNNWKYTDVGEKHLTPILKRIENSENKQQILSKYQEIFLNQKIQYDRDDQILVELRLSGLVVNKDGYLKVFNPIYKEIFNQEWINTQLNITKNEPIDIEAEIYNAIKSGEFCYLLIHPNKEKEALLNKFKEYCDGSQEVIYVHITPQKIGNQPENMTNSSWYLKIIEIIYDKINPDQSLTTPKDFWSKQREETGKTPKDVQSNSHKWFNKYLQNELLNTIRDKNIVIIFDGYEETENPNSYSTKQSHYLFNGLKFKEEVWKTIQDFYNDRQGNPDYKRLHFMILDTPIFRNQNKRPITIGWRLHWLDHNVDKPTLIINNKLTEINFGASDLETVFNEILRWTGLEPFLFQIFCQKLLTENLNIAQGKEADEIKKTLIEKIKQHYHSNTS